MCEAMQSPFMSQTRQHDTLIVQTWSFLVKRAQDGWGRAQRGRKKEPGLCFTLRSLCVCRVNAAADRGAEKMEHVKCMSVHYVKVHMGFTEGRGPPREESGKCRVSLPIPLAVRAWYWYHSV